VKVSQGVWRRHIQQLRLDKTYIKDFDIPNSFSKSTSEPNDEATAETPTRTGQSSETVTRRYPLRDRKPQKDLAFHLKQGGDVASATLIRTMT